MLEADGKEAVPALKEERFLADAQKTGDEWEEGQSVFTFGTHIQCLRVQHLHKVLQARYVYLIFNRLEIKGSQKLQNYV